MTDFKQKVIHITKMIPYGKVASYGQVALMCGIPRAAQAVGQVLKNLEIDPKRSEYDLPWWRVINNYGRVSIKGNKYHNAVTQKSLLEEEGIEISEDLTFNIKEYRWIPSMEQLEKFELPEENIEILIKKYYVVL